MSEQRGVIFDWGGVIMRTEDYSHRHRWDDKLGVAHGSVEQVVHGIPEWNQLQHGTIANAEYQAAVARRLDLTLDDTKALLGDFYKGDRLNQAVLTLIETLNTQQHVRLGLMSNNILALRTEIAELALTAHFEAIVISAEIGVMKPHPNAYLSAVTAINLQPQQCLFIDDSPINIQGAQAAGLHAIHFTPDLDLAAAVEEWLTDG